MTNLGAWNDATNRMNEEVHSAIRHPHTCVNYAAYENDENGIPIDNLHEVAIKGLVQVIRIRANHELAGGYPDESEDYFSPVLTNPTWLDLAVAANEMIRTTGDFDHCFFEDFKIIGVNVNGVQAVDLFMGS